MTIEVVERIDWSRAGTVAAPRSTRPMLGVAGRCSVCEERITMLDGAQHDVARVCDVCCRTDTATTTFIMTTAQYALVELVAARRGQTPVMVLRSMLSVPAAEPLEIVQLPTARKE